MGELGIKGRLTKLGEDNHSPAHVTGMSTKPRFRVLQQTSGYTGVTAYIVVSVHDGRTSRVSVHAFITRETAQASADSLNAMEAQHAANLADPAWVARRDRVLAEQEAAEQARSDAFARLIADQKAERQARSDAWAQLIDRWASRAGAGSD